MMATKQEPQLCVLKFPEPEVEPDPDSYERELLVERCVEYVRRTPSDVLIAYLPTLAEGASVSWHEEEPDCA